jgi:hypothetical protein
MNWRYVMMNAAPARVTARWPTMASRKRFFGEVHRTSARLNRGLDQALANLASLDRLGLLRDKREFFKTCCLTLEEMRAWANYEIGEALMDRAEKDWIRFGRLRHRREKRLRDPNDVLIEADQIRRRKT